MLNTLKRASLAMLSMMTALLLTFAMIPELADY